MLNFSSRLNLLASRHCSEPLLILEHLKIHWIHDFQKNFRFPGKNQNFGEGKIEFWEKFRLSGRIKIFGKISDFWRKKIQIFSNFLPKNLLIYRLLMIFPNALCVKPLRKWEFKDWPKMMTSAAIFLKLIYFRQKYLDACSLSVSLSICIWVPVENSQMQHWNCPWNIN